MIAADWQNVKGPHSETFHECIGAGRAAEGLRAEWQRQLQMCQVDIGFKYIRFHGLLCDDMASWVCRDAKGGAQVLLWDLTRPGDKTNSNQAIFRKLNPAHAKGDVRISLTNVPPGNYRLTLRQVGYKKNDAYSAYLKMDAPDQLTRAQERNCWKTPRANRNQSAT